LVIYRGYGLPVEDLISEATTGLLKAAERFDPDHTTGARFATFCMYLIRAQITEFVMHNASLIKIGTTAASKKLFFKGSQIDDGTPQEVAERFHVRVEDVITARQRRGRDFSLNEPVGVGDEDREWQDVLEDTDTLNPEEALADAQEAALERAQLDKSMSVLTDREREILLARYEENPAKLQELSEGFGISRERCRQIQARAEEKLRTALGVREPPPPLRKIRSKKRAQQSRKCKGCGVVRSVADFRHWGRRCISCEKADRVAA
jgi:RNA polymerase sigma-32 factor